VFHAKVTPTKQCHAKLLADGKPVPGWDRKSADQKKRIEARAKDIKELGDFKTRGNSTVAAVNKLLPALALLTANLPGNSSMRVPLKTVASVKATYSVSAPSRVIVDTGNLTGKHLFCDKSLFSAFDTSKCQIPVAVANDQIETTAGGGECLFNTIAPDGNTNGRIRLDECAYAPSLGVNLFCVQLLKSQGIHVDLDTHLLTFPNGSSIPFDKDYTLHVSAVTPDANSVVRGKHGPTHIPGANKLTVREQNTLDLWSARLNGLPADRMKNVHKIVHGAPDLLQRADVHNTMSTSRLLASGKQMSTKRSDGPIAKNPGDITSMDWCSMPPGYLGFNGFHAAIDNATGHFRVYPAVTKAQAHIYVRRYELDAARDGIQMKKGSVLYTDNEQIYNSVLMYQTVDDLNKVHEFSAEYEPWGNGGVESVNRYVGDYIRCALKQGGAPSDLWPFAAIDSEVLNIVHERNGKSIRENWSGKKGDISRRRALFCYAIVRNPVAWRNNKLEDRALEAVYLGKARDKQGWLFLTEEHGLVTSTNATWYEHRYPFKEGWFRYGKNTGGHGHSTGLYLPVGIHADDDARDDHPIGGHGDGDDDDGGDDDDDGDGDSHASTPFIPPSGEVSPEATPPRMTRAAREAAGLPALDHAELFGRQATNATTGRAMYAGKLMSPTDVDLFTQSARRDQYLNAVLRAQCVRAKELLLYGGHLLPDELVTACSVAAAPEGTSYIPKPRDRLDELDEAVQAVWAKADAKEFGGILEWAKVIKVKDLPKGTKTVGTTAQRKFKRDLTPKTRVCIQGFSQIPGLDFTRNHSPCMAHASLRTIFGMAACLEADIDFCDYTSAYTQSDLDPSEYVYARPPPGYDVDKDGDAVVWLITKSLYGMKQAGRNWYFHLKEWLVKNQGFEPGTADPCCFYKKTANGLIILGVYVDDLVIVHTDKTARDAFIADMKKEFAFTDQGPLTEVLGMQVEQTKDHVTISHEKYINNLVDTFMKGEANRKEHKTPASLDLPRLVNEAVDSTEVPSPELVKEYRSLVGSLLYTATTVRPDISYAVGMLSRALNKPTDRLLDEAKRVLQYLAQTAKLGIRYVRGSSVRLYGMTDSDWTTRRSTSGFAFFLAGAVIAYLSKKQPTIALSSTEAEIMAASVGAIEAVYLRMLLADLGQIIDSPTTIFMDNSGAIDLAHDYIANERTKHIERRHFKVRELVEDAAIRVKYIASHANVADIFTKPLDNKQFKVLRAKLMNMDV